MNTVNTVEKSEFLFNLSVHRLYIGGCIAHKRRDASMYNRIDFFLSHLRRIGRNTLVLTVNISFRIAFEWIKRECCRAHSNVVSKAQATLRSVSFRSLIQIFWWGSRILSHTSPVPQGAYKRFRWCARLISFGLKISNKPCTFPNLSTWRDPTEVFPRYNHLSTWWQELLVLAILYRDAHRSQKPCVVRFYGTSYGAIYRLVTNGILAYEMLFTYSDYTNTKHPIWIVYWRCVSHLI